MTYVALHAWDWAERYPWFAKLRFHNKGVNLLFRFKPWLIFLQSVFSRPDFALLGLGFARSHSDNSFVQILRTGGVMVLAPLLFLVWNHIRKLSRQPQPWVVAATISLTLGACVTDVLIFRAAGTLFFWLIALNLAFPHSPQYRSKS
jgi:hypothetical protein